MHVGRPRLTPTLDHRSGQQDQAGIHEERSHWGLRSDVSPVGSEITGLTDEWGTKHPLELPHHDVVSGVHQTRG